MDTYTKIRRLQAFTLSLVLTLLTTVNLQAQTRHISGTITSKEGPVAAATVQEVGDGQRIINQTTSNANGLFNLNISSPENKLRVIASGMRTYAQKIGTQQQWTIELEQEGGNITDLITSHKGKSIETQKLIDGRLNYEKKPQFTWVKQLNDTLFTISLPIRVNSGIEEYPEGRMLRFLDKNDYIVFQTQNALTVTAEEGIPGSYNPYVRVSSNNSTDRVSAFSSADEDYFCYPKFLFTLSEMQFLISNSNRLSRIAIDTSRADNVWFYYPSDKFAKELQRIITKMSK